MAALYALTGCRTGAAEPPRTAEEAAPEPLQAMAPARYRRPFRPARLSKEEVALLQPGDIILRRGHGWVSDAILRAFDEETPVTHAGIVVQDEGRWWVIHAESNDQANGMQVVPLRRFVADSYEHSLVLCRPKGSPAQRAAVVAAARRYLALQVPFDFSFDDRDSSTLYCTEMIDLVLRQAFGRPMLPERLQLGWLAGPRYRNFLNPQYFEVLVNQNTVLYPQPSVPATPQ